MTKMAMVLALGLTATGIVRAQTVVLPQGSYKLAITGAGQTSDPLPKDDLFAGTEIFAKNATDVTEITMDPDSLAMVDGKDKDKARNTILQVVRTYEYDKPGMYNMADVDKFREKLNTGDWHCSIHTRSLKTGESTDICSKRRTDDLHETAIITVEPKELTFIHTISHRAMNIGMPGMGEMGFYPGALGSLSSLAMLDPEMLELRMQINSLKSGMHMNMLGPNMMVIPDIKIDNDAIQKSIDKEMKDWDKSGAKMKEFMSPDGMHRFMIMPDGPKAPEMPVAPESGAAPKAPELPQPPSDPAPAAPAAQHVE